MAPTTCAGLHVLDANVDVVKSLEDIFSQRLAK